MFIRNFCIIAHIDHGKSTLADRLLEVTGTIDKRKMKSQFLDQLELERERGITIKMAPVRMIYHPHRELTQINTQIDADEGLLYKDLTYRVRGAIFDVANKIGYGFKESIYQKALEERLTKDGIKFLSQPSVKVEYENKVVGYFRPDLIIDDSIIIELKAQTFVGDTEKKQVWSYLKGSSYKLALLVNFGPQKVEIERIVYDTARNQRASVSHQRASAQVEEYILNLIDTPGHPDFGYEVSRALEAVEGAILLVDGTQGIQAQTLSNLYAAQKAGLTIIGAVNKVDMHISDIDSTILEVAQLLHTDSDRIHRVSGKTGEGVADLLHDVVATIPPPRTIGVPAHGVTRALVFDSFYDDHKGIIAVVRVFDGVLQKGLSAELVAVRERITIKEVGYVTPRMHEGSVLTEGEIGYVVTGLKDPHKIKIGDTIISSKSRIESATLDTLRLPGYKEPNPVVFVSFFPDEADDYDDLKKSLERLKLNDASFTYEPDFNEVLGRGFKGGFLGKLHFEIIAQRLDREFGIRTITSFPSVAYKVKLSSKILPQLPRDVDGYVSIQNPKDMPTDIEEILEPMIRIELVCPSSLMGPILGLQESFRWDHVMTEALGDRVIIRTRMPLAELISDFDDRLKSISGGFASFSYESDGYQRGELARLDILVAGESVPGLSRILPEQSLEREARAMVLRLKDILPHQQFTQAIQAHTLGRIIARETIPAFKKDLGNFGKNGGDRTRKMKLWKKQKEGKKKLLSMAKVRIAPEDFKRLLSKN